MYCLFHLGIMIFLFIKKKNKTESFCKQHSYEYKGILSALCGKQYPEYFTPQRIIVIEMK